MSRTIGLWLIGARGGVATTAAVGLSALRNRLTDNRGLVSSLPEFGSLDFVSWDQVVLGGHEIRSDSCVDEAQQLSEGPQPVLPSELVSRSTEFLQQFDQAIRPGILMNAGLAIEQICSPDYVTSVDNGRAAVESLQNDLTEFKDTHNCDSVIVINVASTEPSLSISDFPGDWSSFEALLDDAECRLPSSSLYAIAALDLGMPYVNFTPSLANDLSALQDLAIARNTCHMGHDGKTGETFLKSVLAPGFAKRNLEVMSWVGHNIFGNMDGQILNDPANKQVKVASKSQMLSHMLGYEPQSHISIEYIKSLGDWKTAWDHIHFRGFLGTPMSMQFTWQGCDSILAAPLVLDLFRFTELAHRNGETGLLSFLSSFFKSPIGTDEHDFSKQFQQLIEWASSH